MAEMNKIRERLLGLVWSQGAAAKELKAGESLTNTEEVDQAKLGSSEKGGGPRKDRVKFHRARKERKVSHPSKVPRRARQEIG